MTEDTVRRGGDRRTVGQPWATVRRLAVACLCLFVAVTVCSAPALASDARTDSGSRVTGTVSPTAHSAVAESGDTIPVRTRYDGTTATPSRRVLGVSGAQNGAPSADTTSGVTDAASLVCGAGASAADVARDELSTAALGATAGEKPANAVGSGDGERAPGDQRVLPRGLAAERGSTGVEADAVSLDTGDRPSAARAVAPDTSGGSGQPVDVLLLTSVLANGLLGALAVRWRGVESLSNVRSVLRRAFTGSPFAGRADESEDELDHGDPPRADREVVVDLLAAADGRLYQSEIVERTGWSKATVSRRLAEMDAAGEVVKIRLGRQNLVCLDGAEPEIAKPRE